MQGIIQILKAALVQGGGIFYSHGFSYLEIIAIVINTASLIATGYYT